MTPLELAERVAIALFLGTLGLLAWWGLSPDQVAELATMVPP